MNAEATQSRSATTHHEVGRTQGVRVGYKATEVGVIPEEWQPWPVEHMGDVITGKALAVHAPGPLRPYLRTKNVFDGRIETDDVLKMPMTDAEFEHFQLRPGDVLLNEGQSLELVGRCAIYRGEVPHPCAIQNQLLRFRARAGVSAEFAAQLFRYSQRKGVFARIALQTTSIAHLGGTRFQRLRLPWPERESEQLAIAEALLDADRLLAALDALVAKKRDLKLAAMQQLLTGMTRLPGFERPWRVSRFGRLFEVLRSANNARADLGDYGDVGYLHYGDVHASASPFLDGDAVRLPGIEERKVAGFPSARDGDLVMVDASEDYEGLAKSVELRNVRGRRIVAGLHTFLLRPNPQYLAKGFGGYLQFVPSLRVDLTRLATGISVFGISKRNLGAIELLLPEPEEQVAIADVLADMDAELQLLEARREKTRMLKEGMMQELLTGKTRIV